MNKKAKSLLKGIIVLALLGVIIFFGIKLIIKNDKSVSIKDKNEIGKNEEYKISLLAVGDALIHDGVYKKQLDQKIQMDILNMILIVCLVI